MTKTNWSVCVEVQLKQADAVFLDSQRAQLLSAIERTESLSAAAKDVGVSYRKAWDLVRQINADAETPLLVASPGGNAGGTTQLTESGQKAIHLYENVSKEVNASSARILKKIVRPETRRSLRIAAAISLEESLGQLISKFTLLNPTFRARAVYGGSDEIAEQIRSGATFDIFITADKDLLDPLIKTNAFDRSSLVRLARNTICVIGPCELKVAKSKSLKALLDNHNITKIAVAQPECPLGRFTHQFLKQEKLSKFVESKLIVVDNSKAVPSAVRAGSADIGFAFSSHAIGDRHIRKILDLGSNQTSSEYWAAVASDSKNLDQATTFLEYLTSLDAGDCYRQCGLHV